jgi:ubiquinone/menaquinone biosynthesis C-methylase UbiE
MDAAKLSFTGERLVPGEGADPDLYREHFSRYLLAEPLAAGKRVLDIGCGAGYGSAHLAQMAAHVVGLDNCAEAIAFAQAEYGSSGATFVVGDATHLPFEDASFDLVVSFELIEHLSQPEALLREMARVLHPKGCAMISTPNRRTYKDERPGYVNPFHAREYYAGEFRALLEPVFPATRLLCQNYAQAQTFGDPNLGPEQTREWRLVAEESGGVDAESSQYFVALCGFSEETIPAQFAKPVLLSGIGNTIGVMRRWIESLQRQIAERDALIAELRAQFEERTAWAQSAVSDAEKAGAIVRGLQAELEERTTWAMNAAAEAEERKAVVKRLQKELKKMQSEEPQPN